MKKSVRSFVIAAVLVSVALGTLSLAAPTPSPDRRTRLYCGGKPGGNACPEGYVCVDLGDYCNPRHGGTDCLGYCKELRH